MSHNQALFGLCFGGGIEGGTVEVYEVWKRRERSVVWLLSHTPEQGAKNAVNPRCHENSSSTNREESRQTNAPHEGISIKGWGDLKPTFYFRIPHVLVSDSGVGNAARTCGGMHHRT